MKKEALKYKFIELRALGYTYNKICSELKISNPTAIKWGRHLSLEIKRQQKYLMSNIFSQRIAEQEQGLMIKLEQFRRTKGMSLPKRIRDKIDKKILKEIEKVFIKRISAIHLNIVNDNITNATFIFDDDLTVRSRKD